jgi:uncharacterized membrane protein YadS
MADDVNTRQQDVVIDKAETRLSDLWKKEDYWAIWLGFALIIAGMLIFLPNPPEKMTETIAQANEVLAAEAARAPFKTVAYYQAVDAKHKLKGDSGGFGKTLKGYLGKTKGWSSNPVEAFYLSPEAAKAKSEKGVAKYEEAKAKLGEALTRAQASEDEAAAALFKDEALNDKAKGDISAWRNAKLKADKAKKKAHVKPHNVLPKLIVLCIGIGLLFSIGKAVMGESPAKFFVGFLFVFAMATLAYLAAGQSIMKTYGIGYAAWAIALGLLISNTVGTPKWVVPGVQTEYYIRTGLVLLGAEVLFNKIVAIGIPGIFVAWVVTPVVLICTYIFGQKVLKMPSKTLNITISADMSVCGVSAAIATAAACRAKKEELTLSVGLSLVFTSIMMIVMPAFIKAVGMPHILGGAWMGGTIDATGAVAAAGAFLSDKAMYVAATIKMIQNVLIGVTAFGVAVYWCTRVDCIPGQRVSWMEIWHRFPKFVLGFIAASIAMSLIYKVQGPDVGFTLVDHGVLSGLTKNLRGWFFCLAFTSIGLATDFREFKHYFKGGKPLILYVCGQSFNLALTLIMAYIMFYKVFPEITAAI